MSGRRNAGHRGGHQGDFGMGVARFGGRRVASDRHRSPETLLEHLEPRMVLTGTAPLPSITALENPTNPVARLVTRFGDIDIELFQNTAPGTVANFINYIRDGDYDKSFFHRLVPGFVLQGGGFRYDNTDGSSTIAADPPIQNEFQRSNLERTLAMAKQGGNPNSATNQFFFNLDDNSGNLDNQNGGFTVFARVINDSSWEVVQEIAGFRRVNFGGDPFTEVPVTPSYDPDNISEDTFALVIDAELIKPAGVEQFYAFTAYYPEGFAGSTINEFLPISNPQTSTVHYQVVIRTEQRVGNAESGYTLFRDRVISTGSIASGQRGGITISRFGEGGAPNPEDLVPQGVPYAIEVRSTNILTVNLSHYDFGSSTGETFTRARSQGWTFPLARRGEGIREFLVFQNPGQNAVNVGITFYNAAGETFATGVEVEPLRRGGLNLAELTPLDAILAGGTDVSIRVTASAPIVAALTAYDSRGNEDRGSAELGSLSTGSLRGVVPMAQAGNNSRQIIAFHNTSPSETGVTMILSFDEGTPEVTIGPDQLTLAGNGIRVFDFAGVPEVADGRRFTIRYQADNPVVASVRNERFGDSIAYPVATLGSGGFSYAEGFMDPNRAGVDVFETLSIYNPNIDFFGRGERAAVVTYAVRYTDGTVISDEVVIPAGGRVDIDLHAWQAVLDQGRNNNRFFYFVLLGADTVIVAQFQHYDLTLGALQPSGGFGTLGLPANPVFQL